MFEKGVKAEEFDEFDGEPGFAE